MEYPDVRREILLQVDKEVKELTATCSVDKLAQKICSQDHFWKPIFEEYKLPFPNTKYDNVQVWISTFEKERKLKIYTDRLIEILEHPKLEDFNDDIINFDEDISNIGLLVYINQCPWLEVFNIEEINYNQLLLIVNSYIINKFSEEGLDDPPSATIFFVNDGYVLRIISYIDIIYIDISRETAKTIFYRILSYGVIPLDTYTMNPVKLIL